MIPRLHWRFPLLILLLTPACAQLSPPQFRLPDTVRPTQYRVELELVPTRKTFSGTIDIDVEVRETTPVLWLNASDLTVRSATIQTGGISKTARAIPGGDSFLGLALDTPVAPGPAHLQIVYEGQFSEKSSDALFINRFAGETYLFSQFEPTSARKAFPCFDQPQFKTPWRLTLRVPEADSAFSNTPIVSEVKGSDGLKTIQFAESPPLPSYLVAMAVGPFEVVNAGTAGRNHTPVRIVTPKGRASEARYAASTTPVILTMLEDYFGIPFPYAKLDNVAIPLVFGFEAMENAGMVTYAQSALLASPADETIEFQRNYAIVCAHELSHQWFGDLVTPEWWNDLWLNEAFATWMESKIVSRWKPQWGIADSDVLATYGAMAADSLISAREIRQPVLSESDIANAFDAITYEKGAAVIRMFESWIGEQRFRSGVHRYLQQHAWGNATAADFLSAISHEAGTDVAGAFGTFLDQTGVPLVSISLRCGPAGPQVELSQKRYLPLGSAGSPDRTWQTPVCVHYSAQGKLGRACALLTAPSQTLTLAGQSCPDWVGGNAGALGYYLVNYSDPLRSQLLRQGTPHLETAELTGLLGDMRFLTRGGKLPESAALALVPQFAHNSNRFVTTGAIEIAQGIRLHLVPDSARDNYRRFVRKTYGSRAHAMGWTPKPGEDDNTRLLRPRFVTFVARDGADPRLVAEAGRLARKWLADRKAIAPEMVTPILTTAAEYGGRPLFDEFLAAAKKTKDLRDRERLLNALDSFPDPALAEAALNLTLDPQFDARESYTLLFGPLAYPQTLALPFEFVKRHFDALVKRLPSGTGSEAGALLPSVAQAFCSEARREEVEAFFRTRVAQFAGAPRNLDQVLESISICAAVQKAQQGSVEAFLKKY